MIEQLAAAFLAQPRVNGRIKWTAEFDSALTAAWGAGVSVSAMFRATGASKDTFSIRARKLGLPARDDGKWTVGERATLRFNIGKLTVRQIAVMIGKTPAAVKQQMMALGLRSGYFQSPHVETVRAMVARGCDVSEIAKATGLGRTQVIRLWRRYCPEAAPPLPPKPEPKPEPKPAPSLGRAITSRGFVSIHPIPPDADEEIAAWIATHPVTRCPAAAVAITTAQIPEADRAALRAHQPVASEAYLRMQHSQRRGAQAGGRARAIG